MTDIDVSKLHKDAQALTALAIDLGWLARNWKQGGVILSSPTDSHVTVMLPSNGQLNASKRNTIARKIWRYGDPEKAALLKVVPNLPENGIDLGSIMQNSPAILSLHDSEDGARGHTHHRTIPQPDRPLPTVVSETPWMARHGSSDQEGRHYESGAVIERKWSDGTTDYRCTWPDCGYHNPQPRSVARHYGSSRDHAPVTPGPDVRGPAYEWTPRSQAKADKLAREIRQALQAMEAGLTDDQRAQFVAEYIVREREKRRETHEGDAEIGDGVSEPLTADQVLERIRRMVDDGSYMQRVTEAEQVRAEARELREQLQRSEQNCQAIIASAQEGVAELERTRQALREAESEWTALREIIDSRKAVSR